MIGGRLFLLLLGAGSVAAACDPPAQTHTTNSAAALTATPLKQTFEEWILACNNTGVCRAQSKGSSGAITIRREPGPNGALVVLMGGIQPSEESPTPNLRSIRLGGTPSNAPWRIDDGSARLDGEAALAFIRALARTSTLTFDVSYGPLEVPLAGLRTALRAMDRTQGQRGGESAFVDPGPRRQAEIPAGPPLPVVEVPSLRALARLPASFAADVRRANPGLLVECDTSDRRDLDEAHPLTRADALVVLECSHGFTHTSYLLLRVPRTAPERAQPVALPWIAAAGDRDEDRPGLYTGIGWDANTASLWSETWSCAHACGENIRWVFDGRDFRLALFSVYQGGGIEAMELYRAEVRPVALRRQAQSRPP